MNVHVYFGIENLSLTVQQRGEFVTALQALGAANGSVQPAERNHWRIRNDNNAVIFEALFDEDRITVDAIKAFLGSIFSISPATINHAALATARGRVFTFSRSGTDYLRMVAFGMNGGSWPTWQESGDQARAYLAANAEAWGEV